MTVHAHGKKGAPRTTSRVRPPAQTQEHTLTFAELVAVRAKRKDELDLPNNLTKRDAIAYVAQTAALDSRIIRARDATATLADLEGKLVPEVTWRDHLRQWRETFNTAWEALDASAPETVRQGLKRSILTIDWGATYWPNGAPALGSVLAEAIAAAGYVAPRERPGPYWAGCLPDVDQRIADIQLRMDAAQAVRYDALLGEEARAKKDAAQAERTAKKNALPQRKTRADGSQYDKWPNGRRVEVSTD